MKTVVGEEFDAEELKAQAAEYHSQGFNCAQSVACALAPKLGMDADAACRMTEGFGLGMGGMNETCGAISGGVVALGFASSRGLGAPSNKKATYQLSNRLVEEFRQKNGATQCRELKGVGCDHPMLRSCPGCIDDAVELTVGILKEL